MDTQDSQRPDQRQSGSSLRTADELFARPDCTHIITLNSPSQNLHLERTPEGFQFTAGLAGAAQHASHAFASLDAVYQDWDRARMQRSSLREPIWQDISGCPAFSYGVLWRPLDGPFDLQILPDSEHATAHGPHAVFGPVELATPAPHLYRVTPTAGWLVVEYPTFTLRGRGGRAILRPPRTLLDRLRLALDNRRLRHATRMWTRVRPGVLIVYGTPPADWQTVRHVLPAEPSAQPAPPAPPAPPASA
ncbi:MAG TPA: hypothetical protein VGS80_02380 [Ktedonobacterales bacterium]|nr:hypothetical protein [Ktedonobacterales bacterium]